MALRSQLFRNDPKLEAAAVSDSAHILPNAVGLHVGKIHVALAHLDGAVIDAGELQRLVYGPSTASAVLVYKQKRSIINRSYQTQADNIVGKMTIAALDSEMIGKELLFGPTRIIPLSHARILPAGTAGRRAGAPLVAFKVGADVGVQGGPRIVIPDAPQIPAFSMDLPRGGSGKINVINGKGGMIRSTDNNIAIVSDPAEPLAHSGTMPVFKDPHVFIVSARLPGQIHIVATNKSRTGFGEMLTVRVQVPAREVTIAFHFLVGGTQVATQRDRAALASAVGDMNSIYENQTRIRFRVVGPGSSIIVPEFAKKTELTFLRRELTPDWNALTRNRSGAAHWNVFFAKKMYVHDQFPFDGEPVGLTNMPGTPHFKSRDTVVQDDLKGVDLGLVLAHEAGHALGEDESAVPGHLMNPGAPGRTIPPDAAGRMNDHAGKL